MGECSQGATPGRIHGRSEMTGLYNDKKDSGRLGSRSRHKNDANKVLDMRIPKLPAGPHRQLQRPHWSEEGTRIVN